MQMLSPTQLNKLFKEEQWPEFLDVQRPPVPPVGSGQLTASVNIEISIRPEIDYFAGHFPEHAVLPGVVQVHWAAKLSQLWIAGDSQDKLEYADFLECSVQLKKVKFIQPVLPSEQLTLQLKYRAEKRQISFRYINAEQTFSSGLIEFAAPSAQQEPSALREPSAERDPSASKRELSIK